MKNYKDILAIIKKMISDGCITQENAEKYFPELVENEDERIKNIIKKSLRIYFEGNLAIGTNDIDYAECLAWLEKQGEWNEDDKIWLNHAIQYVKNYYSTSEELAKYTHSEHLNKRCIDNTVDWLKFLKDRCLPQPKSEWSEEDESHIKRIVGYLETYIKDKEDIKPHILEEITFLKSFKDRYLLQSLQPKQMTCPCCKVGGGCNDSPTMKCEDCPKGYFISLDRDKTVNIDHQSV